MIVVLEDLAKAMYDSIADEKIGGFAKLWSELSQADRDAWIRAAEALRGELESQIFDELLWCPFCHARHIDEGRFEHNPHHTHACQSCGFVWRPAKHFTRGVRFLPGFGPTKATE